MAIDHWMIFGTFAEQRYFIYPSNDSYTGVIFNGNMVSHAPNGLAAFLIEKTNNITYIIDPLTHAFQHDPSAITKKNEDISEVKSSIRGLADSFGDPVKSLAGARPILPSDFENSQLHENFVKNCLEFQKSKLSTAMASSDNMKYFEDNTIEDLKPYALVAPYFYMTETSINRWINLNIRSAEIALNYKEKCKLYTEIVIGQSIVVSKDLRNKIIKEYTKLNVDGFILWIDDFDEHNCGSSELEGLFELANGLRNDGKYEVINLHGGYFSVLSAGSIGNYAFSGIAHGPEFGESRPVIPVGGGIPIARYYIPLLHNRIKYRDTVRILRSKNWLNDSTSFHENVCSCRECRTTINGNIANFTLFGDSNAKVVQRGSNIVTMQFPTSETKERCLRHYLQVKALEFQFANTASKQQILDNLQRGIDEFEGVVGIEGISHLELWRRIFK